MNEIKRKAIKSTLKQILATATVALACYFLWDYLPLLFSMTPLWVWGVLVLLVVVCTWYSFNYDRHSPPINSPWVNRKSEIPPSCELINAEVMTAKGKKKVLWRKHPSDIDFSNDAPEPVICYLVLKK